MVTAVDCIRDMQVRKEVITILSVLASDGGKEKGVSTIPGGVRGGSFQERNLKLRRERQVETAGG